MTPAARIGRGRELPSFLADFLFHPMGDSARMLATWNQFFKHGRKRDFQELVTHFAPIVGAVAMNLRRRYRSAFADGLDSMVSDGFVALLTVIERTTPDDLEWFEKRAYVSVKRAIDFGPKGRTFAGRWRTVRGRVLKRIAGQLQAALGRKPTRDEMADGVRRWKPRRPEYLLGIGQAVRTMRSLSEFERNEEDRPLVVADTKPDALQRVIEREAGRRLFMGLRPAERRLAKLIMHGASGAEAGRKMGISRQRVHQLLERMGKRPGVMEARMAEIVAGRGDEHGAGLAA